MSKSFRKTPIFGNTKKESEKKDKRIANRIFRRHNRQYLPVNPDKLWDDVNQALNAYKMAKDGKNYWAEAPTKCMRK